MQPLVSVIIPVYNQARYILQSASSVIDQQWPNLEMIIVDDGSTDNLETTLQEAATPFTFIQQENKGPAGARNAGLQKATGDFITFLDADDTWPSHRLKEMMPYFEADPYIEVLLGYPYDEEAKIQWQPRFGTSIIKKIAFKKVGLLEETLRYSEDQDWFLRAKELGVPILAIPVAALNINVNRNSLTYNKSWKELHIHRVLKDSLDRRRAENGGYALPLKTLASYQRKS